MKRSIWIGWDPREADAFTVAHETAQAFAPGVPVNSIDLRELRKRGLYWRPTSRRNGNLWDLISDAPMSTEFAISRFMTPFLAGEGLALFMDGDVMVRSDLTNLFDGIDPSKAVSVVQHHFAPPEGVKMDGQTQTRYARKNWSSVCVFNADHPSNRALTTDLVNTLPGRDLHRFCWLRDDEIAALDPKWNWLAGHSNPAIDPAIVHFTEGVPSMDGYADQPHAAEWFGHLRAAAA